MRWTKKKVYITLSSVLLVCIVVGLVFYFWPRNNVTRTETITKTITSNVVPTPLTTAPAPTSQPAAEVVVQAPKDLDPDEEWVPKVPNRWTVTYESGVRYKAADNSGK